MQPPTILRNKSNELYASFGKSKLTPSQTRQAHRDGDYCGCKTCVACLVAKALKAFTANERNETTLNNYAQRTT